ncbi:MAG: GGDEF domain-containing protein [Spirochaetae bacterium HGW-Spirochaetae-5]|nr:MAG: GGDEF domain-containing protein [Spirochaetae bacterium HGW-Spirochaetae-5]
MLNENENILKNISIFEDTCDEDLDKIASEMKRRDLKAGELIFREGDPGDELYVIVKGGVSIFIIDKEGKEVVLSDIMAGNFFGEMSIIEQAPRSANCRVMPECAVKIMNKMLSITVKRLMNVGAFVTQMVQWGAESRKRAITDPATGLFNRRYLEDSFEGLVNRARTEGNSLSFVMFDMDRFGSLNTKYGQEFCDGLIVTSAQVFREVFSKDDILVRYGGDEFIFIFPGADAGSAQQKCDALCSAIRELRFPEHEELRLSCSMGFATMPHNASNADELKDRSDKALYRAKEEGRDRAVGFTG